MTGTIESKIWVFVEQRQGHMADVGLELLGKALALAKQIDWEVAAILVGHQLNALPDQVLSYGAHEVLVADDPLLTDYCNETYVKVLENAIKKCQPEVFLLGATAMGTDLGPRLAARLRTGLSAHCIDLEMNSEGELLSVIPWSGGNYVGRIRCPRTRPQMATVLPGLFDMPRPGEVKGGKIQLETSLREEDMTYRVVETCRDEVQESGLETAEVVVAGGWGIGSQSDWEYIKQLASELNGAVGATRPPVDEGWADENQMIGQSGLTVSPKLYIGIAISGHMHHLVGIKGAELTVGINKDPEAHIFEYCDLGLVGDFREIIPALLNAIENYRS
jgi:electron transfer flavoprotein alpha subunit